MKSVKMLFVHAQLRTIKTYKHKRESWTDVEETEIFIEIVFKLFLSLLWSKMTIKKNSLFSEIITRDLYHKSSEDKLGYPISSKAELIVIFNIA